MKLMTLQQAMEHAATDVHCTRTKFGNDAWAFDKAVEYWQKRALRADLETGTAYYRDGWLAHFTGYDWADVYSDMPHAVFHDFFKGALCNSAAHLIQEAQVDNKTTNLGLAA